LETVASSCEGSGDVKAVEKVVRFWTRWPQVVKAVEMEAVVALMLNIYGQVLDTVDSSCEGRGDGGGSGFNAQHL